jgi:ligand-binding SRPBCC domain-containing protein
MYNKYQKISQVECGCIEELFNFHLDTHNLERISHPSIKTKVIVHPENTQVGEKIHFTTRRLFIPTYWEVEVETLEKPYKIVNIAHKSPFNYWKHSHTFAQKDYGIEWIEQVEFIPPLGVVGRFLEPVIIKEMDDIFEHRHRVTLELLKEH